MTDLFDDADLFAVRAPAPAPARVKRRKSSPAERIAASYAASHRPAGVASFACPCGALEEVLEPAPERVDCWRCEKALAMRRWTPPVPPPTTNARRLSEAERARLP